MTDATPTPDPTPETPAPTFLPVPEDPKAARLAIAREVLALLDAGALVPTTGAYLIPGGPAVDCDTLAAGHRAELSGAVIAAADAWRANADRQLAEVAGRDRPPCGVCALGGLLVAAAGLYDRCRIADLDLRPTLTRLDRAPIRAQLLRCGFTDREIDAIEAAYEGGAHTLPHREDRTIDDLESIRRFRDEIDARLIVRGLGSLPVRTARLRAIMQHIVDHDGDLVIPADAAAAGR